MKAKYPPALLNKPIALGTSVPESICEQVFIDCDQLPALTKYINCSRVSEGVEVFSDTPPSKMVSINTGVQLLTINITSGNVPPYYDPSEVLPYYASCPLTFVVDNSNNPYGQHLTGTACGVPCLHQAYSNAEWHILFRYTRYVAWTSVVLSFILFILSSYHTHLLLSSPKNMEDNIDVSIFICICFCEYSILSIISTFYMAIASINSLENYLCSDEVTPVNDRTETTACTIQGGVVLYTYVATLMLFLNSIVYMLMNLFYIKNLPSLKITLVSSAVVLIIPVSKEI